MKKTTAIIVFLCIGGVIVFGWIIGRLTHAFDFYTFATDSNMPTHHVKEFLFTSNMIKPNYGRFVCFSNKETKGSIYIFRVIGMPNDVIEIKDAVVFRNGKKLDEPYTWNEYTLTNAQYQRIAGFLEENNNQLEPIGDNYNVTLTDAEVKTYHLTMLRETLPKGMQTDYIYPEFKAKNYNSDNLGPVKVPADSYFLMGDNRHYAMDSRYLGFIKLNEIKGVRLGD